MQLSTCRAFYHEIFRTVSAGEELLRISRAFDTRWISIEPAVARTIDQWKEIKIHHDFPCLKDKLYIVKMLLGVFSDKSNLVYLLLFKPILSEVQALYKNFEPKAVDPYKLLYA